MKMNKKEIEDEFHRIVNCLRSQGDLDCLENLIPLDVKEQFIKDWSDEE